MDERYTKLEALNISHWVEHITKEIRLFSWQQNITLFKIRGSTWKFIFLSPSRKTFSWYSSLYIFLMTTTALSLSSFNLFKLCLKLKENSPCLNKNTHYENTPNKTKPSFWNKVVSLCFRHYRNQNILPVLREGVVRKLCMLPFCC